ncbi:MAG TPA: VanZ family protein [Bryobacteraceae bacterium]|nr:VanZ family protein [Bryobacteraceae bacterium]
MKTVYARRGAAFLILYVIAVGYASLYPWEFSYTTSAPPLSWHGLSSRIFLLDSFLNIVFYAPLGAAAFVVFGGRAAGLFFAVAMGFTLSFGVEEAQRYTSRMGDYNDIVSNTLGTAVGAFAGYAWSRTHGSGIRAAIARRAPAEGLVLAALWLTWNVFLLLPAFSRRPLPDGVFPPAWSQALNEALGAGVVAIALRRGACFLRRTLAPALLLWLAIQELTPFQWGVRQDFSWLPFEGLFYNRPEVYYPILFGKLFFYTVVVWALRFRGTGWFWSVSAPIALLAVGEWAQTYIPERTPESTDLVLAAGGAFVLWMAAPGLPETQRSGYTACSEVKG